MFLQKFLPMAAVLLLIAPAAVSAQNVTHADAIDESDVQMRVGFELNKKIRKRINISWEEELRLRNNLATVDRIHSSLGATYRVNDWFRVGAAYTFIARWHDGKKITGYKKYWDLRHRAHADFLFTLKSGNWQFSMRERAQFTVRTDSINVREKSRCDMTLRHRFKTEYRIYSLPLRPYVSVELSNTLNAPKLAGNYLEKVRSMAGVEWRLSKGSTLEFYYRFDYVFGRDIHIGKNSGNVTITPEHGYYHILGIFYAYSF